MYFSEIFHGDASASNRVLQHLQQLNRSAGSTTDEPPRYHETRASSRSLQGVDLLLFYRTIFSLSNAMLDLHEVILTQHEIPMR